MGDDNADLGHLIAQEGLDLGQIFDPGHDKEGLAATIMLAQQRLAQRDRVELGHIGADRKPVDRRCPDHRQIAHTRERHLQGARNGRGRERQHMHIRAHLFQPLLVVHAKALFLIHDQQA